MVYGQSCRTGRGGCCLCALQPQFAAGSRRRDHNGPHLWQRSVRFHAICRPTGSAQEGTDLAFGTRAGMDARTSLAGLRQLSVDRTAFRISLGVGLTKALMWLFSVVFVSGIVGAVLQHFMPRITTQRIPLETIYEQIGRVRTQLMEEAISLVDEAYAVLHGDVSQASEQQ